MEVSHFSVFIIWSVFLIIFSTSFFYIYTLKQNMMNCKRCCGFNKGQSLYTEVYILSTDTLHTYQVAISPHLYYTAQHENMFYWNATKIKCQNSWKCCGVIKVLVWGRNIRVQMEYSLYRNKRQYHFHSKNMCECTENLLFHIKSARAYSYNFYFNIPLFQINIQGKLLILRR